MHVKKTTYTKVKVESVGEVPPNLPSTHSSLTVVEERGATATIAWVAPSPVSPCPDPSVLTAMN